MDDDAAKRAWVGRVLGVTIPGVTGGKFSVFALGRSRLEWRKQRLSAIAELGRLQAALTQKFANDTAQKQTLQAALKKFDDLISELGPDLDEDLDAVLNADEGKRKGLVDKAKSRLAKLERLVEQDPVVAELDGNEVLPDMKVTAPMRQRLNDIAASLG